MILNKTDWLVWKLKSQLRNLEPGTRLPSLRDLQKQHGVSLTTLNRVIAKLKDQKKIEVIHGNGMFVAETTVDPVLKSVDIVYFGGDDALNAPGYFRDLVHGLVVEFGKHNVGTTISTLPMTSSLDTAIRTLEKLSLEAAITVFLRDYSFINYFDELKVPNVVITPDIMDVSHNCIYIDNEAIIQQIFNYLLSNGHSKIAYLNAHDRNVFSRDLYQRELFYYRECIRHNLPVSLDLFCDSGYTYEDVRKSVASLLESGNEFSALIIDDQAARAVYDEFEARGIIPGKDVSVIGIDDLEMNKYLKVPLTSVRISQHEIARHACNMTQSVFDNYSEKLDNIFIEPEFVERQSVSDIKLTAKT